MLKKKRVYDSFLTRTVYERVFIIVTERSFFLKMRERILKFEYTSINQVYFVIRSVQNANSNLK